MIELDKDEKLVLKVRRHKLALFIESCFLIFFVILPPILFWIGGQTVTIRGNDSALFAGAYSAVLLMAWMIFFMIWTNYYLDVLLVTEKRIIDIEQRGFFHREVSTVRLENIEDITVNVSGIVATFMDYGTLRIQTAAESREFIIRHVPEPNKIKAKIYELHNNRLEDPQSVRVIN